MFKKKTRAYGKINIGLKVGSKRSDGYHDIDSYFMRIPFYDEIFLSLEEGDFKTRIKGNEGYLEKGKLDIMEKAALVYSKATGHSFSLDITIDKNIPTQAGLGGGSADASSVLLFLNSYFKALNKEELISLSKEVGADVPFFTSGATLAHVEGIGETITPLNYSLPYGYISLFRAKGSGVSTKEAYEKLDSRTYSHKSLPPLSYPLIREDFPNDFEILEGKEMLNKIQKYMKEGDFASLSGSGSVWYLLSKERILPSIEEFLGTKEIL